MNQEIEKGIFGLKKPFEFDQLPFPPSTNELYLSFVRGRRIMRVPSKPLVEFKKEFAQWAAKNSSALSVCSHQAQEWFKEDMVLELELNIFFDHKKVFKVDGGLKRNDVSNRIKALEDCFCDSLNVDDKFVFRIIVTKQTTRLKPWCSVVVRPVQIPTL